MIRYIRTSGNDSHDGVSEYKININTPRLFRKKGLLLVGSSRSGRIDFENAIQMMEVKKVCESSGKISFMLKIQWREIKDIHRVLATDLNTAFKQCLSGKFKRWRLIVENHQRKKISSLLSEEEEVPQR